jgi:WD40 repeat protein
MLTDMASEGRKPVIMLVSANTGQPLSWLEDEVATIDAELTAGGRCDIVHLAAATLGDLYKALNDEGTRDRIRVVHYAGHANGQGIELVETAGCQRGRTAFMDGLARVLAPLEQLRLLFLNGCSTQQQALVLLRAGVPLVIATKQGVADQLARDVAVRFYGALGQNRPVEESYAVAGGVVDANVGGCREVGRAEPRAEAGAAWDIYGPRSERAWRLGDPPYRRAGPRWNPAGHPFNPNPPYPGLRPFKSDEAHQFFGREAFVSSLVETLTNAPLRVVVGASGSGKSSVVRAGLVPAWRKKFRKARQHLNAFVVTPEDDPFDQVSVALGGDDRLDRAAVRAIREGSSTALRDAVTALGQGNNWLVCIDQFEQLFTRTRNRARRDNFIAAVADLATARLPRVALVLVLRDEFFPHLQGYPDLCRLTDPAMDRIIALGRDALREVVERPAAEHGVGFAPGLVDEIVGEVEGQPADLPLLQYTLRSLWDKELAATNLDDRLLKRATYRSLEGVRGSLGERFEKLYREEDEEGRAAFRSMMLRLIRPRNAALDSPMESQLVPLSKFRGKEVDLVRKLIDEERLLTTHSESVQFGHDRILEAWPRFSSWAKEYREANQVRQRLGDAAHAWQALRQTDPARASTELWQGAALDEALKAQADKVFDLLGGLDPHEADFLKVSQEQRELTERLLQDANAREEQARAEVLRQTELRLEEQVEANRLQKKANIRLRRVTYVLIVSLGLSLVLAGMFEYQRRIANKLQNTAETETTRALDQTRIAQSRERVAKSQALAIQAVSGFETHPQRSLLLAVESLRVHRDHNEPHTTLTEIALRRALHSLGGRALGHRKGLVLSLAISPNGQFLARGGPRHSLELIDLRRQGASPILTHGEDSRWLPPEPGSIVDAWTATGALLEALDGAFFNVTFSNDGRWLAACGLPYGKERATVYVWDLSQLHKLPVPLTRGEQGTYHIFFSKNSELLIAEQDDSIMSWKMTDHPSLHYSFDTKHAGVERLYVSRDGARVATLTNKATLRVFRLPDFLQESSFSLRGHEITAVDFAPSGRRLLAGCSNGVVAVWDCDVPERAPTQFRDLRHEIVAVGLSPDERWVLAVDETGKGIAWPFGANKDAAFPFRRKQQERVEPRQGKRGLHGDMVFSRDGRYVAIPDSGNSVQFLDLAGKLIPSIGEERLEHPSFSLYGHDRDISCVVSSKDNEFFATGAMDGTVRVWRYDQLRSEPMHFFPPIHGWGPPCAISPDSQWVVVGETLEDAANEHTTLWARKLSATSTGAIPVVVPKGLQHPLVGRDNRLVALDPRRLLWAYAARLGDSVEPEGPAVPAKIGGTEAWLEMTHVLGEPLGTRVLMPHPWDKNLWLWDAATPEMAAVKLTGTAEGRILPSMGGDLLGIVHFLEDKAQVWDLRYPHRPPVVIGSASDVTAAARDGKGDVLAIADRWGTVKSQDTGGTGAAEVVFSLPRETIKRLCVAEGGRLVVAGGESGAVWVRASGKETDRKPVALKIANAVCDGIAVTPDGTRLIVYSKPRLIGRGAKLEMWDITDLRSPVIDLGEPGEFLFDLLVTPDGRWLIGTCWKGVLMWRLRAEDLCHDAARAVGRNLTEEEWRVIFPHESYRPTFAELPDR